MPGSGPVGHQDELTSKASLAHRMAVDELGALKAENAQLRAALRSGGNGNGDPSRQYNRNTFDEVRMWSK